MPHGGGHIGGGHHGGGGFHGGGGGFRHHHHHHHGGGGVYIVGGGWGWGYRRRGRPMHGLIWAGVGIFITIVVVLSVTLSIRFGNQENEEKNYSPGDSRIYSFNTFFCSSIKVSAQTLPEYENGKVYYLTEIPPLTDRNRVNISQADFNLGEGSYEYWHFYLYPNSNLTYSGCVDSTALTTSFDFYLIKGTSKFNTWKDSPSTSKSVAHTYVTRSCNTAGKSNQLTYTTKDEDHYYLVYYNDGFYSTHGQQTVVIDRFEYATPSNDTTLDECSLFSFGSCWVDASFQSSHRKILIKMPEPSNVDFDSTKYPVDIYCAPQAAGYIIVVVVPFTFLAVCLAGLVIGCCYLHKRKKGTYRPINRTQTNETDILVKEEVPPAYSENPPPYNPSY